MKTFKYIIDEYFNRVNSDEKTVDTDILEEVLLDEGEVLEDGLIEAYVDAIEDILDPTDNPTFEELHADLLSDALRTIDKVQY